MGGALLAGWKKRRIALPVAVVEPAPVPVPAGVKCYPSADALPKSFQPALVLFAVKPQGLAEIAPAYRRFAAGDAAFLSIVAGKTLGFFARHVGEAAPVVRAMPNTPAAIGRGITVLCANPRASAGQRTLAESLLAAVGEDRKSVV